MGKHTDACTACAEKCRELLEHCKKGSEKHASAAVSEKIVDEGLKAFHTCVHACKAHLEKCKDEECVAACKHCIRECEAAIKMCQECKKHEPHDPKHAEAHKRCAAVLKSCEEACEKCTEDSCG